MNYDSIIRGYFCIGFVNFMLKSKRLTLFSPNKCKKNNKVTKVKLIYINICKIDEKLYPEIQTLQFRLNKIYKMKFHFII